MGLGFAWRVRELGKQVFDRLISAKIPTRFLFRILIGLLISPYLLCPPTLLVGFWAKDPAVGAARGRKHLTLNPKP